ncbi:hypothetical protein CCM_01595 [Cordyceps militaris CM01]|uniref:Uncharacterized protein n=1 Tax=Cordyceps militaris (strain CM01) TaxID=983644 RepID=G3J5Y5_CORMM|nr:uncharacterized protein CCM_01595 [Cordyceps militaris CM01]EGX96937.1 hypothetical protein CCM_01595 [Cordyceps militaris CM01]
MVSKKNRLYIALYPSGITGNEERRYHWGFLVGPKIENKPKVSGRRFHVKNNPFHNWIYEEMDLPNVRGTVSLLARILIAKIEDDERLVQIFRETPVVQGDANWRCRTWISDALARIQKDGGAVGTAQLDWRIIEPLARKYVAEKTAAGRYAGSVSMLLPKPTWDAIEGRETVP